MDVLSANATRRDAKQYLARFKTPKPPLLDVQAERNARHRKDQDRLERMGVNLGGLYVPSRAIADSPQFTRHDVQQTASAAQEHTLHVALVCLRAPESLDDVTLEGLATTLSQLVKLDTRIVLVLDLEHGDHLTNVIARRTAFTAQAKRLILAIGRHSPEASRHVAGALEVDGDSGNVVLAVPTLVLKPLGRGMVPIIPCMAHTPSGQLVDAKAEDVMAALTTALSGVRAHDSTESQDRYNTTLDRIIVLDQAGGIPSKDRGDNAHVFVNLEQEFDSIQSELSEYSTACKQSKNAQLYAQHQSNLRMLNRCLAMLPSASSALIISPQEVASSSQTSTATEPSTGTGTRRQKNTLIHNLLTNKPMVSSSLPTARLSGATTTTTTTSSSSDATPTAAATATLVKKGMPVTIIPTADRRLGWAIPPTGRTSLTLETDPRVDLARLVHLIEDSFRRPLDAPHYLARIRGRLAGLIVAGAYEGAAILTWESPPSTNTDATTTDNPHRLVPYLDKFAVLQSSQGSSGVADILFQAMVRTAFPLGVCWRSRQDNPVNKWYFERAAGSYRIPGTQWTMFWTGEGVVEDRGRWEDYVGVCRGVVPSWAGGGRPD
ncbi:hypothetical protein LTR36_010087 [Oleoguttula mirabilis]|uniref:Amino-acid acetyltransferase, mitochondrial n=1 Tax=Oleoguttula mirabilis TaxID=1507867 RepID=A0AAV9JRE3_9PEZI|nr:hypothetical protein LTR36_010087 [Oleoguttula mirabilis]